MNLPPRFGFSKILAILLVRLGYPLRKQNDISMGDAVNWEWIIECANSGGKDIIIVTRDSDCGCNHDRKFHLNDLASLGV